MNIIEIERHVNRCGGCYIIPLMWTAPPCQLPIEAPQRYAVTSGPALRDSALQSGRRTGTDRSVPAGLCLPFTASAAAPFVRSTSLSGWMTTFSAREPKWIPLIRHAVTAGYWGTAFGTASGVGTFMARLDCHPTIFITDGIWRRQIEPRPTWRMTARHGISCDKRWPDLSPQLQPDMAQGTAMADYIYKYQYDCQYAEAMADVGTKLSTLFSTVEKIRSVAPLCPTCWCELRRWPSWVFAYVPGTDLLGVLEAHRP